MTNNGLLTNQGEMRVAGNWTNLSSYGGSGTVAFTSESEQIIQHNNQAIGTLTVMGGGSKQLQSSIQVSDTLTLDMGLLSASPANELRLTSEAVVRGGNANSYVLGPMIRSGTGYRAFPVGTETDYLPLVLEDVRGVDPVIQVQVNRPNPDPQAGEGLERVSDRHYWSIELLDGSMDGSLVTLPVDTEDGFNDLLGVVVARSDEIGALFSSLGQSARQGTVNAGSVTSRLPTGPSVLALGLTTEYSIENKVEIPSAFAPEAPNPEDRKLKVYAMNLVPNNFSFTIFNRWGQVVYQTEVLSDALAQGWNGTHYQTNEPLPVGVYHYVLRGRYETNQVVEKTGAVTLFR